MANATRDLYWTHDWSNCVWACCLEPCHILVKKNDLKRHDYKQQIYYINMINLDPLQRLVASILQVCLCKRKTLLLVTMPCTSIGSNTLSVRPHYRQQKVNVEEENMSTCLSLSPPPLPLLLILTRFCFTQRPTRIANCQKFTQLPRPPKKELTTPTTRVPLAHTKWSLTVNTKMGENHGNSSKSRPHGLHSLWPMSRGDGVEWLYKSEWRHGTNWDLPSDIEGGGGTRVQCHIKFKIEQSY